MNFEELGRKVKKFSRSTMEEVQKMNEVRQLNGKINEAHKQIRNLYSEMGKKLYDHYKEEALAGFRGRDTCNQRQICADRRAERADTSGKGCRAVSLLPYGSLCYRTFLLKLRQQDAGGV